MTKHRVSAAACALVTVCGAVLLALRLPLLTCAIVIGAGCSGLAWSRTAARTDVVKRSNARVLAAIVTFVALDLIVGSYVITLPEKFELMNVYISPGPLARRLQLRPGVAYQDYLYFNVLVVSLAVMCMGRGATRFTFDRRGTRETRAPRY